MTRLRLAIIRQKYRHDGGAERFIAGALEALGSKRFELNIVARGWQGIPNPDWNVHVCNPPIFGRISRERGFAQAARACWERHHFDIVQSHERIAGCDIFRAGDGVHRIWLEQRARISAPLQRYMTSLSPYHRYILRAEEQMFHSPALKAVICNSEMVKNDIIRCFNIESEKVQVIYNAVDSRYFSPATALQRQTQRRRLSIPQDATTLIFVGSGFARKGLKAAIKAIAKSDRCLIVLGQDKHFQHYRQLAKKLNCLDRIRFPGVQRDVLPFYHAADALILPTLYDPFPNAVLEAMACGLAIITSTHCGGAELIAQGEQGFVCDALDIGAINEAVNSVPAIIKDPSMGEAARAKVLAHTPQRLANELSHLYEQVLQGRVSTPS